MLPAPDNHQIARIKLLLFAVCLLPALRIALAAWTGDFGPNPVEFLQRWTGSWTLNFLLLTLCVTPLRVWSKAHWLGRLRRMLGLFCFFYASLHLLSFIGFDHAFSIDEIAVDIFKRPFVTAGFTAFLALVPLAATSNQWAIRRLGGRRWQELHRSVYAVGILAIIHYCWLVKATAILWPIAYGTCLALLLAWRVKHWRSKAVPMKASAPKQTVKFFKQRPD